MRSTSHPPLALAWLPCHRLAGGASTPRFGFACSLADSPHGLYSPFPSSGTESGLPSPASYGQSVDSHHECTLDTAEELAAALQVQQKHDEAEPLLRDTLAIQQRVLGDGQTDTLTTCRDLAMLLINTRRCVEAEQLLRRALAQATRTLGPEHPDALCIASSLAWSLSGQQGKAVEAAALFKSTAVLQQRVCGPDHPAT